MEEKTKQLLIDIYKNKGESPGLRLKRKGKYLYTGNEVAEEIANETEIGFMMYNNIIKLTCELLSREKLKIK